MISIINLDESLPENKGVKVQYIASYLILLTLSLLATFLSYLHKKTRYIAKLRARRHIMSKLFTEINEADFPTGDLELYAGEYGAWFAAKLYKEECKFLGWALTPQSTSQPRQTKSQKMQP